MSWIKDNKFAAMLGGATLLAAIVLFYVGWSYRTKYAKALLNYQDAAAEVEEFENLPLYPSGANRDGKIKALNDYRTAITGLQASFDEFRPKELKNITPQDFTANAKSAFEKVEKAFKVKEPATTLPDGFFLGFETYSSGSLAPENATGALNYQLGAIEELMLALAKAGPSQVQNFYRSKSPEEDGGKWIPGADDASRPYPMEITFKATEKSAREFMDALATSPNYFYSVRSLRIANEKNKAPNKADAKFDIPVAAGGSAGKPSVDPFGGAAGFVLPDEEPPADDKTKKPAPGVPGAPPAVPAAPVPAPAAKKPGDSSRILNQILGDEELQVFLRVDVLQFLPVAELPTIPK